MVVWLRPLNHDGSSPIGELSAADQTLLLDKLSHYDWGAPTTWCILATHTIYNTRDCKYTEALIHRHTGTNGYTAWCGEWSRISAIKWRAADPNPMLELAAFCKKFAGYYELRDVD